MTVVKMLSLEKPLDGEKKDKKKREAWVAVEL
jgi:hypothetical protein